MGNQPPPPPPNHQLGVCRALHPYVLVLSVVSIFGFVGFDPCPEGGGRGVTTVCGFGFVSCWEIYALVCICLGDGGQRVMVFAPPTVRSLEQVAVAKFF